MLSLLPALKQQLNELINGKSQTNSNQKLNLLFLQRHDLKNFESNLLKIDKKHYKGIDIYYIGYITIKKIGDCENIYSLKPFYLLINQASGYIEENQGNKYLIFDDSVNENKWLLEKYVHVWDGIKNEMTIIIRSVFKGGGKLYLQVFLDDALYEL